MCVGAGRQSSRRAKRRIVDQIMIITAADKNGLNGHSCDKDAENNCISEDGSSCTGKTLKKISHSSIEDIPPV